jgi:hypothetical protein
LLSFLRRDKPSLRRVLARAAGARTAARGDCGDPQPGRCGIGYNIGWLAAHTPRAAQGVELAGADLNSALIKEAARLARAENLPCQFVHGDAFSPQHSGQISLSTGVIHHFRHDQPEIHAFRHYDFQSSFLAPVGWRFFRALADAHGNRAP